MIDLRSDAISIPGDAMRHAIATAEVGDEQKREDPSVLELERRTAALLGHEDAVFLPSATMANQIALRVLTQPGDEVLVEERAHLARNEAGGPAVHSGVVMRGIPSERGVFDGASMRALATRTGDPHHAQASVVCIENTHNASGGTVWTREQQRDVVTAAAELGMAVHLDGARLLNAAVASGTAAADYAAGCDTVTLCLCKGLGCPVGAVLAGAREQMVAARRCKHLFGGAMRQAGFLAAAGLYALDHNVERLADDHDNARRFACGLAASGVRVLNPEVETNIVLFAVDHADAVERLRGAGVLVSRGARAGVLRTMTHIGVDRGDIDEAVRRVVAALGKGE